MKKLYVALLLLVGTSHLVSAQTIAQTAGTYNFKACEGTVLENMSRGSTELFGAGIDGTFSPYKDFFNFRFAGKDYSRFAVSEDGVVILNDGQSNAVYTPYQYDNYFTQDPVLFGQKLVYPKLLPWGEDLFTGNNGSVTYKINGASPSRKLIIDFKVNSAEDNPAEPPFKDYNKTFQVWLYEGSNQIEFVYGDISFDWYNNANIGIAASANDYMSVNTTDHTNSSTKVFMNANGSYEPYYKGELPVKGTAYTFSPSPIVDEPQAPTSPLTVGVTMSPEYPVAGQLKHTIYLGYGTPSVTLSAAVGGGNTSDAYTYSWSPATGLSDPSAAAPQASPTTTTTYNVTITDAAGNQATKSITVNVIDPRVDDKFKVCKLGKVTICISVSAVQTQLDGGASLGDCTVAFGTTSGSGTVEGQAVRTVGEDATIGDAAIYPNPSTGAFSILVPASMKNCLITVFDAAGRQIAQKKAGNDQQVVPVTLAEKTPGVYLIRLSVNGNVQTKKVIIN
jgi:hypothetical protein